MPSTRMAQDVMLQLADETGSGPIYDLGSGWGHLVVRLSKRFPQRKIVGYELSLLPWLTSVTLKRILRLKNLTIHRKNFMANDLSNASVLVCYLYPAAMLAIKEKLALEKSNIQYLISQSFALPAQPVFKKRQLNDFYKSPVYLYRLNTVNTRV